MCIHIQRARLSAQPKRTRRPIVVAVRFTDSVNESIANGTVVHFVGAGGAFQFSARKFLLLLFFELVVSCIVCAVML